MQGEKTPCIPALKGDLSFKASRVRYAGILTRSRPLAGLRLPVPPLTPLRFRRETLTTQKAGTLRQPKPGKLALRQF